MIKPKPHKRYKKNRGGAYAALAVIAVIILAVGGYLFVSKTEKKQPAPLPATVQKIERPRPINGPPPQETPPQPEKSLNQEKSKVHVESEVSSNSISTGTKSAGKAQLSVIIDDMGGSMQEARSLASIGVPLTFSIIPGLLNFKEVAAFAASNGIETMIHMPMQPKEWPQRRLEANGLLLSMKDAGLVERLSEYMREIPKAVGANNHMGSSFTENEEKMRVVLHELKDHDKFFIDSVTSPQTVGLRLAREMGLKSARRNIFLDNVQNREYIKGQLNQAVRLAQKTGASIAICHPHPTTIKTLQELLPTLKEQGVTLVSASQLVR
ncbi:MAG TPA: divergent polysaccharide deacetylase family protein [Desulfuromonadaceae bacterium]